MNFEKMQEAINPNVIPKSKFTGVSWDGEKKKWIARLSYNKKAYYAGRFDSEIEAAKAHDECMRTNRLWKEKLNFPTEVTKRKKVEAENAHQQN